MAKKFIITVDNNKNFVGVGAGGVQFAQGKATTENERLANWFKEHDGYTVIEEGAENKALEKMTVDELKAFADEKNVDISAAKNKGEILAILQAQQ